MKNISLKSTLALVSLVALAAVNFSSCKKDSDDPVDQPKTLNKSYLYDKEWFNQGPTISHRFNSNGTYYNIGTWAWLNDSDSMEVKITGSGSRLVWYFEWSTEHEFSAKPSKNSGYILFKDQKW